MIGTLVNTAAVLVGGAVGCMFGIRIRPAYQAGIQQALGVAIFAVGLCGLISQMLIVEAGGRIASTGELLLIIALVLGMFVGECLRLDDRLNGLGQLLERRFHLSGFTAGFVSASLLFCVGAMSIVGPLNEGLTGDAGIVYVKSMLDGVSAVILASSLGVGVLAAALPVLLLQGSVSLCAGLLGPVLQGTPLLGQICMVGYALILCIGFNFVAKSRIKTANLLPALLVPVLWAAVRSLFHF